MWTDKEIMAIKTDLPGVVGDAIAAHGGTDRWRAITSLSAPLSITGALWSGKGHDGALADATVLVDTADQHVEFRGFGPRRLHTWFEPGKVILRAEDGTEIAQRDNPRASFPHDPAAAWDELQVAYFASYAIWNYLTLPFLLAAPGIEVTEVEPWPGGPPSWRRVSAQFRETPAETHNRLQYYNFDSQNLLVRHDYDADVLGGVPASNEAAAYREFGGIMFPTQRRVTARSADGAAGAGPILVAIDFGDFTVRGTRSVG
jgi:hypothetical protein